MKRISIEHNPYKRTLITDENKRCSHCGAETGYDWYVCRYTKNLFCRKCELKDHIEACTKALHLNNNEIEHHHYKIDHFEVPSPES